MSLNPRQFQQLPMFMSGREIKRDLMPGDFSRHDTEGWSDKIADSEQRLPLTTRSIRAEGVHEPVRVRWDVAYDDAMLSDGHHRVALSSQSDPDRLIPVEHFEGDARRRYGRA